MNDIKYYLFVSLGLLALILTFFVEISTPVGYVNEYQIIGKIKWGDGIPSSWDVPTYVYTYYFVRIGIIIELIIPPKRLIIISVLLIFLLSTVSGYFIYSNDTKLVTKTFVPYLVSMAVWVYLGLTMKGEKINDTV